MNFFFMNMLLTATRETDMLNPEFETTFAERRLSPRYKLQEGSMATGISILGPILDLSMKGMSFEYYSEDLESTNSMEVGIFISSSKTLLTGLQGRIVRDHPIENKSSFLPTIQKKRAIEFLNITEEQHFKLEQILISQTTGLA
jgi:hypothetical protein